MIVDDLQVVWTIGRHSLRTKSRVRNTHCKDCDPDHQFVSILCLSLKVPPLVEYLLPEQKKH